LTVVGTLLFRAAIVASCHHHLNPDPFVDVVVVLAVVFELAVVVAGRALPSLYPLVFVAVAPLNCVFASGPVAASRQANKQTTPLVFFCCSGTDRQTKGPITSPIPLALHVHIHPLVVVSTVVLDEADQDMQRSTQRMASAVSCRHSRQRLKACYLLQLRATAVVTWL
jgi:hypothetical protein